MAFSSVLSIQVLDPHSRAVGTQPPVNGRDLTAKLTPVPSLPESWPRGVLTRGSLMTGRSLPGQAVFRQCFMITTVDGDGGLPSISATLSFWSALLPSQSHCFSAPRSTHTKLLLHSRGPGAASKHNFTYGYLRKHARTGFSHVSPHF